MADNEMKISREQARMFAYAIYRDIAAYVESHQEEYRKFIETKEAVFDGKDTATHRPQSGKPKADRK